MARDYMRCCVACLAERQGTREHDISLAIVESGKGQGALLVVLPLCDEHRDKPHTFLYLFAQPANWISK